MGEGKGPDGAGGRVLTGKKESMCGLEIDKMRLDNKFPENRKKP